MSNYCRVELALILALTLPAAASAQSAVRDTSWRRITCVKITAALIDTSEVFPRTDRRPPDSLYLRSVFVGFDPDASAAEIESALKSEGATPVATIMRGFVMGHFDGPLSGAQDALARVARLERAPRVRGAVILSTVERAKRWDNSVCPAAAPPRLPPTQDLKRR